MRIHPLVLMVDDDVDTREMYAWSLEVRGFDVVGATSAAQARELIDRHHPDVVVTDFTLPGEDGFTLASRVRAHQRIADTPLVLVSGRAFLGTCGERAMQLFDRVLLKPVLPDDLIEHLVPLLLDRTAARLERQLRDVRARLTGVPHTSDAGRVLTALTEVLAEEEAPAALVADSAAQYIAANDAACALTGRTREDLLASTVWDLTPAASMAAGRAAWAEFVKGGSLSGAYVLKTARGGEIEARFASSAHILPDCHLSLLRSVPAALLTDAPR